VVRRVGYCAFVRIQQIVLLAYALVAIAAVRPLPPLSWTCPMHAEVVTDKRGACPICSMNLVAVRLDSVWSCQLHPDFTRLEPGRCPIDGRTLVRMIKALSFTCPAHPKVTDVNPGRCPIDKRPLVAKYSLRPHGDHNPKHGGQFLMAPNNWHVEVTHPVAALFRLYVYDDYSRPFVPHSFNARIVAVMDATGKSAEVSILFRRSQSGPVLEAPVPALGVPATIAVKVRFQPDDQEYHFDFPFLDYSKEPR
jgi:hypothetical protein